MMICEEHETKGCIRYLKEYNKAGLVTHSKDNEGFEWWREYNKAGLVTHFKNNKGFDEVYKKHKCTMKGVETK